MNQTEFSFSFQKPHDVLETLKNLDVPATPHQDEQAVTSWTHRFRWNTNAIAQTILFLCNLTKLVRTVIKATGEPDFSPADLTSSFTLFCSVHDPMC